MPKPGAGSGKNRKSAIEPRVVLVNSVVARVIELENIIWESGTAPCKL